MSSREDLTGRTFGNWKVIDFNQEMTSIRKRTYWNVECQCEKHTRKALAGADLKRGNSTSCGCLTKKLQSNTRIKDLTGMIFGRLTVLYRSGTNKDHHALWHCRCSCGNERDVSSNNLLNGNTHSCGCYRQELGSQNMQDLTGQRFGKLVATNPTGEKTRQGSKIWECHCDCGCTTYVSAANLKGGSTNSCGCITSKGNFKVTQLLTQNNILFEKEYSFEDLMNTDTNYKLFFDFAVLDEHNRLSYLIEYDGEQHFLTRPQGYFSEKSIEKIHFSDKKKNEYCLEHNIPLIRIPYTRFNELVIQDLIPASSAFLVSAEQRP